jgi:hypothetical protein
MAHARQDLAAERVVVRFTSQAKGLDEVPLGKTMLLKVICHPPGEAGQLRSSSEEFSADGFRVSTVMQERPYFVMQVAHNCQPGSPATEQVIEPVEGLCNFTDRIDIGAANLPC